MGGIWEDIAQSIIDSVTPSAANAEVVPGDPEARKIFAANRGNPQVEALHARPEKVNFKTTMDNPSQPGLYGLYGPGSTGPRQISMDLPQLNRMKVDPAYINNVFKHEVGHGVADLSNTGGFMKPTGYPAIDQILQNLGIAGRRIPKEDNEHLADAIAGTEGYGPPTPEAIRRALDAMLRIK